MLYRRTDDV
jgi:hypothetical protein